MNLRLPIPDIQLDYVTTIEPTTVGKGSRLIEVCSKLAPGSRRSKSKLPSSAMAAQTHL